MIHLMNGRGQLGEALSGFESEDEIYIYHTWEVWDKSEASQFNEHIKFCNFVDHHKDDKIVFISTYAKDYNSYWKYKTICESYLMLNCKKHMIIKLPNFVGKGVCTKLKTGSKAYGSLELITLNNACSEVKKAVVKGEYPNVVRVKGEYVSADLVQQLIMFGGENDKEYSNTDSN